MATTKVSTKLLETVGVAEGGTGATSTSAARTSLGLGTVATLDTVSVATGGTGATSASAARTALGLVIGTNVLAPSGDGSSLTGIAGGGIVIQSAQTTDTTNRSTTSSSYVTTNISAVLASDLKDTGSRVRVRVMANVGASTAFEIGFTLHDGTSTLHDAAVEGMAGRQAGSSTAENNEAMATAAFEFLHTPGTVTPKTYTLQWKRGGSGTAYLGRRGVDGNFDYNSATIHVEELD